MNKLLYYICLIVLPVLASCNNSTQQYQELLSTELNSGIRRDSILLGIDFNMSRKEFFAHCWELNKQKVVSNGPSNLSVEYKIEQELKDRAWLRFYPKFKQDTISKMDFKIGYYGWAPWNNQFSADTLLMETRQLMEKWYGGNPFILVQNKKNTKKVWVKVDGNRRIRIWKKEESSVTGDIADLNKTELD